MSLQNLRPSAHLGASYTQESPPVTWHTAMEVLAADDELSVLLAVNAGQKLLVYCRGLQLSTTLKCFFEKNKTKKHSCTKC